MRNKFVKMKPGEKDKVYQIDEIWEENIKTENFAEMIKAKPYPIIR